MNKNVSSEESRRPRNPVADASFLCKHSFWWLRNIFRLGLRRPLEVSDVFDCLPEHGSKKLSTHFDSMWQEERKRPHPSLMRVVLRIYGKKFAFIGLFFNLMDTLTKIVQPICLGGLVTYFSPGDHGMQVQDAYLFAGGIVACAFVMVICYHGYVLYTLQMGMRVRLTCASMIYKKALRLSRSVAVDGMNGQVINLMSNDVSRFDPFISMLHDLWKGPLELCLMGYCIYRVIGVYGLLGIAFLLCFLPIQTWLGRRTAVYRTRAANRTDRRVRTMNEIIQAIQVIKMYTWERTFASVVDRIRKKELRAIRGTLFIRATLVSFKILSRVAIFLALCSYVYYGNVFTASKVFIVTSYFSFLYSSVLLFWPMSVQNIAEASVSFRRIQEFLQMPEDKRECLKQRSKQPADAALMLSASNNAELETLLASGLKLNADPNDPTAAAAKPRWNRRLVNESAETVGVQFRNASAMWLRQERGTTTGIRNVDVDVNVGRLCAIVGAVGSGKSTVLQVVLGELELDTGSVNVNGRLSYAAQEPWLFEGSIRQNILFTEPWDEQRYRQVVKVCALERDFELFPYGDATVVGERGSSLSGGQRARVNLARAVYRQADIYLLDDPLSAVDTHVGKHIFEKCVRGFLKDKVCVLVTHQLQYLKDVEHVVLMHGGRVEAQGSYKLLKDSKKHSLLLHGVEEESRDADAGNEEGANVAEVKEKTKSAPLDTQADNKEVQIRGSVGLGPYKAYFGAVNNWFFVSVVFALFGITQVAISGLDIFLSVWVSFENRVIHDREQQHLVLLNTTASPTSDISINTTTISSNLANETRMNQKLYDLEENILAERAQYITYYVVGILFVLVCVFNRTFAFFQMCLLASRNLHDSLFRGITRTWMSFFNTNPSGRILNRFSKDIDNIDTILPVALVDCLLFFLEMFAIIILVSISNLWLLFPTIVMSVLFYGLRYVYVNTARSVKRIEAMTRSPIFSHTNATLQGMTTIRVFKAEQELADEFDAHQDLNTSASYLFLSSTRAFALWLELTCVVYMATVLLSFLLVGSTNVGGQIGLAITQIFNLITMCQWGMRQTAELENQMTSVERVNEYATLKPEPPLESAADRKPPKEWPQRGAVRFDDLSMRYTENGAPVLRGLSLEIRAREKIGIVGRTGAGKSSIIQALFRLAHNEGAIIIDGLRTGELGLHDLRSKISIIPQDPVLFSGTMRTNLDPFGDAADADIWAALEQVELRSFVQKMPGGLDGRMSDGGSNFSMGQRQLVCLARAILRNNKILILDEATANVDPETDRLIQTSIRGQFGECTVLTIAHRLHTIMDSDRVLVVDAGRAVEFDHPHELLRIVDGYFSQLVGQTGAETAAMLRTVAEKNYNEKNEK